MAISELDTRRVHFELMGGQQLEFVQYFPVKTITKKDQSVKALS